MLKTTFAYTIGDVSGTPSTESLVYTKDRLDSYKGITISYDANGYPKSFTSLGTPNNFTWTKVSRKAVELISPTAMNFRVFLWLSPCKVRT